MNSSTQYVTQQLNEHQGDVLILHDATELDYTSHQSLQNLGQLGSGNQRGFIAHNSLAVDPDRRETLGLVNQILHVRQQVDPHETIAEKRTRSSRESRLWLTATETLPRDSKFIDVCDSAADTFEFLEHELQSGRRFVIRSGYKRRVRPGHDINDTAKPRLLQDSVRQNQAVGCYQLSLNAKPGCSRKKRKRNGKLKHPPRQKRTACLQVSITALQILPSQTPRGESGTDPLPVWVVRAWEPNPPVGEEPVDWSLLTNVRVKTLAEAQQVIDWYTARWMIEEYHKAMKTGCGIESLQFHSEDRLKPAIALVSIIAVTLLRLRDAGRAADARERLATEIVAKDYVRTLSLWRHREVRMDWSIYDFVLALGRLGGHQNRVGDGPNVEATSENQIWLPGNWVWQQNRYSWRPGFWSAAQANWVWTPSHYLWSPRGYVYVDGYWDRTIDRRGILFAPVSFGRNVYSRRGFSYSPVTVINLGVFSSHLFLRPSYGHYYFGDYYGANYASNGFSPWFSFNSSRRGYDPFYAHQRWHHRNDNQWDRRLAADFDRRRDNEDARPPRTFVAQQKLLSAGIKETDQDRVFSTPLEKYDGSKEGTMRLQSLNKETREKYSQVSQQARTIRSERQKFEAIETDPKTERTAGDFRQGRAKLHQSPYIAKESDSIEGDAKRPKGHEFPKTDPEILPQTRKPNVAQGQDGDSKGLPSTRRVMKPIVDPVKQPEVKPSPKPEVKPNSRPEVNPSPKPETDPRRQPEVKGKPEQPGVNRNPQPKRESNSPQPKIERKPQSKSERKPEPPKANEKGNPKSF